MATKAKATTVKLSENIRPLSDAARKGQAFGALLGESAAQILLSEFGSRNEPTSPASERWYAAWNRLESAIGVMADDPKVAAALKELEDAYGNGLVESEDRAFHAAWTLAMSLKGGAR